MTRKKSTWKNFKNNVLAVLCISLMLALCFSPSIVLLVWYPELSCTWHLLDILTVSIVVTFCQWCDHKLSDINEEKMKTRAGMREEFNRIRQNY